MISIPYALKATRLSFRNRFQLLYHHIGAFFLVSQDAFVAVFLQNPEKLPIADIDGFGKFADVRNMLTRFHQQQGFPNPVPEREAFGELGCALKLLCEGDAEQPQKNRILHQLVIVLPYVQGNGVDVGCGFHKERIKLRIDQLHFSDNLKLVEGSGDGKGRTFIRHVVQADPPVYQKLKVFGRRKGTGQKFSRLVMKQIQLRAACAEVPFNMSLGNIMIQNFAAFHSLHSYPPVRPLEGERKSLCNLPKTEQ